VALELYEFGDPAEWDAFVADSPQGSVFCESRFLEAAGAEFEALAVGEAGRREAAALVIMDHGAPIRAPAHYTMYQGVLFDASVTSLVNHRRVRRSLELVTFLLEALAEGRPRISFCLHPSFQDVRAFNWFHYGQPELGLFDVDVQYTATIDLEQQSDRDQLLAGARKSRRQDHHRAIREGFSFDETHDVTTFMRLYRDTFKRQQIEIPETDVALVESIARGSLDNRFGRLYAANSPDGQVASMALFLHDATTAYYLFGANDPAFRPSGASTMLLFEALWRSREVGMRKADLVGVNSPDRGDYKTSFGAQVEPYFVAHWERPRRD
jgi:hypothetical protein